MIEEIDIEIRFSETDALGHVNHISYFIYSEEARNKFIDKLKRLMGLKSLDFILVSTKCDFISQVEFNQVLKVGTYISKIGSKSLSIVHEIYNKATNEKVAKSEAVLVYFNFEKQQSDLIPADIRNFLEDKVIQN